MQEKKQGTAYHSPDKLLSGFSKGRIVVWMLVAVAIHVVFIGVTSLGYIRDRWVDPDGAKLRKIAAEAALKAEQDAARKAAEPPAAATSVAAATNAPLTNAVSTATSGTTAEEKLLEQRKNTPVGKRLTEAAKINELPAQPGDVGISIEDTNVK